MSRTELYIIKKDGYLELYEVLENSYRGAFLFWYNLWNWKHKTKEDYSYIYNNKKQERLWEFERDSNIPIELRILFISTFDKFIIKKDNFKKYIDAINKVLEEEYFEDNGHFEEYSNVLEKLIKRKDILGVCWNQTDTNSDSWFKNYNILNDKQHRFVFNYLNEIK